jgi:hypothetical protein
VSTGFPREDAGSDFTRQRRREALARIAARLRAGPDDAATTLPFEPVVSALGRRGERDLGIQSIPVGSIVGTVDRRPDSFDRSFRPRSPALRARWERIAAARRRGEAMPPIDVYRVGDLHFVNDGHHRVSVARAHGDTTIDARVREVSTELGADAGLVLRELPLKHHERMFFERVPLPQAMRARISLSNGFDYAGLAEGVEAWGFRAMQARGEFMTREQVAREWFEQEYAPVVEMLREADLIGEQTETEAYARIVSLRYLLLRTHEWDEDVLERLREELRGGAPREEDTLTHLMRGEMRG